MGWERTSDHTHTHTHTIAVLCGGGRGDRNGRSQGVAAFGQERTARNGCEANGNVGSDVNYVFRALISKRNERGCVVLPREKSLSRSDPTGRCPGNLFLLFFLICSFLRPRFPAFHTENITLLSGTVGSCDTAVPSSRKYSTQGPIRYSVCGIIRAFARSQRSNIRRLLQELATVLYLVASLGSLFTPREEKVLPSSCTSYSC